MGALGKMGMRLIDGRSAVAAAAMGRQQTPTHNVQVLTLRLSYWLGDRLPDTAPGNRWLGITISVANHSGALLPPGLLHVL